jgi:copper homeostasis protein
LSILIEAAVETLNGAVAAAGEGAGRLELCGDLPRGGTTPGPGLLRSVRAQLEIPIFVMIRPRPGEFRFTGEECESMLWDIAEAKRAGADGVVIGVLNQRNEIDCEWTERLVKAARPLKVTFHRAIDRTPDLTRSIELLAGLGVDRVLTGGGPGTALAGVKMLAQLARNPGSKISILPGGGVRAANAAQILRETGLAELHVGYPAEAEPGRIAEVVSAVAASSRLKPRLG